MRPCCTATFVVVATIAIASAACGEKKSPTPPTPTVNAVSISPGTDTLTSRQSETFTASATLSDGTTQTVTAQWSSSANSVLTIDGNGRATAVSHGSAMITASYQGRTATRNVSVINDYAGNWSGDYLIRACDASQTIAAAGFCAPSAFAAGQILPVSSTFLQTRSSVTGTIRLGSIAGPFTGSVQGDGSLAGPATLVTVSGGLTFTFELAWTTRLATVNSQSGTFVANVRIVGAAGNGYLENTIRTFNRTSGVAPITHAGPNDFGTFAHMWAAFHR